MNPSVLPLSGTYTPIVTPFSSDGSLDLEGFDRLVERQIEAGVEGLVVLGTTGESPTVSEAEAAELLGRSRALAAGRAAVIAGIGSNDTAKTRAQAERAAALGADALLVTCPYYSKPTQAGLFDHFARIADAVDLPQIVYNIEGRTGVNVETDTLIQLAAHPRIVGVKEASNDIDQIMDVIDRRPSGFAVLSGSDHLNFVLVALGGDGSISSLANLVPERVKALIDAGLAGDLALSRRLHYELLPLARGCFFETNPIPLKTALAWQGWISEAFRPPLCPMQPETRACWQALLEREGLLAASPLRRAAGG